MRFVRAQVSAVAIEATRRLRETRGVRLLLAAFGWANLVLGIVGLFVPVMPTMVFLLIALWALSESSAPGYQWLRQHPRFGETLRAWDDRRALPKQAKLLSVSGLASSGAFVAVLGDADWTWSLAMCALLAAAAVYIMTRPDARLGERPL
ncbi:MAG: YbaN family protein [Gemmatimonas sp.]